MKKRSLVVVAVFIIAAVVLAGSLTASNMGFKLNFPLNGPGSSNSGTNYVSLPYNTQVGISHALALFQDIKIKSGGNAGAIQRHSRGTDTFQVYTFGTVNFLLRPGEAYIVNMAADLNYIIVGSHDPSVQVYLDGAGVNGSLSGTNYYSHPYHAVSADAQALLRETGATAIQRHSRATDTFQVYTFGTINFGLFPGDGYIVNLGAGNSVTFTPAHY